MTMPDMKELRAIFLSSITGGDDLSELMEKVRAATGLELLLLDVDARLIAYSVGDCRGRIWEQILEKKCVSQAFLERFAKTDSRFTEIFESAKPVFYEPGIFDEYCYYLHPAALGGLIDGVLVLRFTQRAALDFAKEAAPLLCSVCAYYTRSEERSGGAQSNFIATSLAKELLMRDGDIERNLFSLAYRTQGRVFHDSIADSLKPGFAIAALTALDKTADKDCLERAEQKLPHYIHSFFHYIDGDTLLLFLSNVTNTDVLEDGLYRLAHDQKLYCGVSAIFDTLNQRMSYKSTAISALKYGMNCQPAGYVFRADKLYHYVMLEGAANRLSPQVLELSALRRLVDYDRRNGTEYLRTLELYLRHANKLSPASQAMFVDRSTMKYRLSRIKELLSLDFDQPSIAQTLLLAMEIQEIS